MRFYQVSFVTFCTLLYNAKESSQLNVWRTEPEQPTADDGQDVATPTKINNAVETSNFLNTFSQWFSLC